MDGAETGYKYQSVELELKTLFNGLLKKLTENARHKMHAKKTLINIITNSEGLTEGDILR